MTKKQGIKLEVLDKVTFLLKNKWLKMHGIEVRMLRRSWVTVI